MWVVGFNPTRNNKLFSFSSFFFFFQFSFLSFLSLLSFFLAFFPFNCIWKNPKSSQQNPWGWVYTDTPGRAGHLCYSDSMFIRILSCCKSLRYIYPVSLAEKKFWWFFSCFVKKKIGVKKYPCFAVSLFSNALLEPILKKWFRCERISYFIPTPTMAYTDDYFVAFIIAFFSLTLHAPVKRL